MHQIYAVGFVIAIKIVSNHCSVIKKIVANLAIMNLDVCQMIDVSTVFVYPMQKSIVTNQIKIAYPKAKRSVMPKMIIVMAKLTKV
jgi:hypothetical protein